MAVCIVVRISSSTIPSIPERLDSPVPQECVGGRGSVAKGSPRVEGSDPLACSPEKRAAVHPFSLGIVERSVVDGELDGKSGSIPNQHARVLRRHLFGLKRDHVDLSPVDPESSPR